MVSEADQLRRKSRASEDTAGFANPPFPLQAAGTKRRTTPGFTDTTQPVNVHETPKQDRNKSLRENGSVNGRRSSSGSRGKRISTSYETSGIIGGSDFPHSPPRSPIERAKLHAHSSTPQFCIRLHPLQTHRPRSSRIAKNETTPRMVRTQSLSHTYIQLITFDSTRKRSTTKTQFRRNQGTPASPGSDNQDACQQTDRHECL